MLFKKYFFILSPLLLFGPVSNPDSGQMVAGYDSEYSKFSHQSANHAPLVKFIKPQNHTTYTWNTELPYQINVSDDEDGDSKYQEIQGGEVLLRIKYVEHVKDAERTLKLKKLPDTVVVTGMLISNCFNCHGVKIKLAGPSFQEINKHYLHTTKNLDTLAEHIKKGSTGIWGKETMPSHPELSDSVVRNMVKWIFNYTNDPGLNFITGLEGMLPLRQPGMNPQPGYYILTALYTDHGTAALPQKKITGSDQVIIQLK
jgi:cytochrome c